MSILLAAGTLALAGASPANAETVRRYFEWGDNVELGSAAKVEVWVDPEGNILDCQPIVATGGS